MATHSVLVDPVKIWAESPASDAIARKLGWSDCIPVRGGWMRRRPRVPGLNDHRGKWYLNRGYNQHFRFNPVSNGTHMETATEELQFHWNDRNPASVTSRDCDAGRTSAAESPHGHSERVIRKTGDQGLTMVDEADDLSVFDPYERRQQAVEIERSGMEAERDERYSEESTAALSELNPKHRNITRYHKFKGQHHRTSSAITSDKSALASFSDVSASVASTSDHVVTTSSSATETATTVATWIFGTIMAGVGVGIMRVTQKIVDAGTRSVVVGESSALSSRKSAAAAEESARAATKSAQAAENGVAVMQKQLEVMIQDKHGPPPAGNSSVGPPTDNSDSGTGSVEARSPDVEIPREEQRARSVPTATPPAPGAALTSAPMNASQEGVPTGGSPKQIDPAQAPEVTENSGTSKRRAVPIKATPSARMLTSSAGTTTANISSPQGPTLEPGEPSVNQSPPKQVPSIRTSAITLPNETIRRKEGCLRNITAVQDELKSRKKERESMLVLERRLQELRNRFA
ncbi:hypothetical protein NW767_014406 [Fusarium falciforme]|nr:hypothetical protein NW767_014406 [Fusarium falciforme]